MPVQTSSPSPRKIVDIEALSVSVLYPDCHKLSLKENIMQDLGALSIDNTAALEEQNDTMGMASSALLQHGQEYSESPSPRSHNHARSSASPEMPHPADINLDKAQILVHRSPRTDPTSVLSNSPFRSDDDDIALVGSPTASITGELSQHHATDEIPIIATPGIFDDVDTEMHHGNEYISDQEYPIGLQPSQCLSKAVTGRSAAKRPLSSPERS